jgi:hypothetical protein
MLTLLYLGIVFTVVMCAVTVCLVASARDGFEDEFGFHSLSSTGMYELSGLSENAATKTSADRFPVIAAR